MHNPSFSLASISILSCLSIVCQCKSHSSELSGKLLRVNIWKWCNDAQCSKCFNCFDQRQHQHLIVTSCLYLGCSDQQWRRSNFGLHNSMGLRNEHLCLSSSRYYSFYIHENWSLSRYNLQVQSASTKCCRPRNRVCRILNHRCLNSWTSNIFDSR